MPHFAFKPPPKGDTNLRLMLHSNCNLKFQQKKNYFSVCLFNGGRYDYLFLIRFLLHSRFSTTVEIIPKSANEFISFSFTYIKQPNNVKIKISFIDTYLHLHSSMREAIASIDNVSYLKSVFNELLPNTQFNRHEINKIPMFYDLITSFEILEEKRKFPSKEEFRNSLMNQDIENEEYEFAKLIWREKKCESYLDYVKVYGLIDTGVHLQVIFFEI